jgi:predicted TIM-barrel fold metal-dependent hydrolase
MTDLLATRQPSSHRPHGIDEAGGAIDGDLLSGVDAHAHLFVSGLPLAETRRYAPDYEATLDDYLGLLDSYGLAGGVVVQPSFLGFDNGFLLDCVSSQPERLRGVVAAGPDIRRTELRALQDRGAVGVRLNLIGAPPPDMSAPSWQAFLRMLADLGLHVEVQAHEADWVALMPPLLTSGADLVIDHFGRPSAERGADDAGFSAIRRAAQTGRVWVKMSGPYRFGHEAAAACARALAEDPGPERLVWGSDWPFTQFEGRIDYGQALDWLFDWLPSLKQRSTALRDTARQLYRFE